jgi:hypothetical protein
MELIFLGAVCAGLFFTGLWKFFLPIFFGWWLAFMIAEHRQKTKETKNRLSTDPVLCGMQQPAYTVNYFGPVW